MGDSQTIAGLILAALAIVAALVTLVLMVMLQSALAKEAAATRDSVRAAERQLN